MVTALLLQSAITPSRGLPTIQLIESVVVVVSLFRGGPIQERPYPYFEAHEIIPYGAPSLFTTQSKQANKLDKLILRISVKNK
jgi:hypothetical protein